MKERRRSRRVSVNSSIADDQSSFISNGEIIDISEHGIRYSQIAGRQITNYELDSSLVRTVFFSLPGNKKNMCLTCSIISERTNDQHLETSGDFVCLSNEDKLTIRKYINKQYSSA